MGTLACAVQYCTISSRQHSQASVATGFALGFGPLGSTSADVPGAMSAWNLANGPGLITAGDAALAPVMLV